MCSRNSILGRRELVLLPSTWGSGTSLILGCSKVNTSGSKRGCHALAYEIGLTRKRSLTEPLVIPSPRCWELYGAFYGSTRSRFFNIDPTPSHHPYWVSPSSLIAVDRSAIARFWLIFTIVATLLFFLEPVVFSATLIIRRDVRHNALISLMSYPFW